MYIVDLDSVGPGTPGVGMKASGLSALSRAGFAVPKGFVVTAEAFEKFLLDTGISRELPGMLAAVNAEEPKTEPKTAFEASRRIREMFSRVSGNDFLIRELREAYSELSFGKDANMAGGAVLDLIKAGRQEHFVSVRPSTECPRPGCECSFSGHGKASLNLIGYRQILAAVKECWLSVFSPEAMLYRKARGIGSFSLGVIVQKMVDSELSGMLFTSEPVSGDRTKALVEGFWGLGETLSAGSVCPDQFLIDKETGTGTKKIGKKIWLRRRGPFSGNTIQEKVPLSKVSMETLSERDFPRFASIAKKAESLFGSPQEIEWCVERGRIVLLQARPVVFSRRPAEASSVPEGLERLAAGAGISNGTATGKVLVFPDISRIARPEIPAILAVKTLGMDMLPYVRWFSGVVAEQGGCGSCMASLGRELGIPIITGVENACILLAGKEIMVDGEKGDVYLLPFAQKNPGP